MSSHAIEVEFESRGTRAGQALLLEERLALALIDRAAQMGIPVRAIDQVRPENVASYATLKGAVGPQEKDFSTSWDRAREFIRSLSGRGLLFEVVLEDAPRTQLVRPKSYITAEDTRAFLFSAIVVVGIAATMVMMSVVWGR